MRNHPPTRNPDRRTPGQLISRSVSAPRQTSPRRSASASSRLRRLTNLAQSIRNSQAADLATSHSPSQAWNTEGEVVLVVEDYWTSGASESSSLGGCASPAGNP